MMLGLPLGPELRKSTGSLAGWPAGWLAGRPAGCLAAWLPGWGQQFAHVFEKGAKFAAEEEAAPKVAQMQPAVLKNLQRIFTTLSCENSLKVF